MKILLIVIKKTPCKLHVVDVDEDNKLSLS